MKEKRRILIVDDGRDNTHLIKVLLEKDRRLSCAGRKRRCQGLSECTEFQADLVLLDMMMPQRDGGEVATQIEADPELQRTPIIFLTALVTKAEAKAGLRIQGRPVLAKPISIPELINEIGEKSHPCMTPEGVER